MLKWNQNKVKNLSPMEIWLFIVGRVFLAFGLGIMAMKYFPQVSFYLDLPAIIGGVIFLTVAAKGLLRRR